MSLLANQRARSATEIVDASVRFCRAHPVPLLTIAAIVIIPPAIVALFVPTAFQPVVSLAGNLMLNVGGAAASVYLTAFMTEGEISVGEAFGRVPVGRVIATSIAYGIAVILGLLLVVIPGLIFGVRFWLSTTVAAVERPENSNKALSRSWALTKGHGMHAFGTMLLSVGVAALVAVGVGALLGLVTAPLNLDESIFDVLFTPILMIVSTFVWVSVTLLYIDLRVRVEGADIEASVAELPRAGAGVPASPHN